jgi:hypothetical protein
VICFDGWTEGAHHYQRLLQAFGRMHIELMLIHLGSWGDDPGRPREEQLGQLHVRDISYYAGKSFPQILEAERPAAVIFLSTDTFLHRAFNRYCRSLGIPTIHLFHAIRKIVDLGNGVPYKVNPFAYLKYALSRLPRSLKFAWPTYCGALWKTGALPRDWVLFGRDIVCGALAVSRELAADDAKTDRCCIYIDADRDYAINRYGFAPDHVVVVGNPDLTRFGQSSSLIGSHLADPQAHRDGVMYIDSALISMNVVFKSESEFIEHVLQTSAQLAQQGKNLVFKPHPGHSVTEVVPALAAAGIEICSNERFGARLRTCCACIAEPSSLTVLAALTGIPVFLASYGRLEGQSFAEVLTTYPRSQKLSDVRDFSRLLAHAEAGLDTNTTMEWIRENAGPLPAEEMPDRVAGVVLDLIGHARHAENA